MPDAPMEPSCTCPPGRKAATCPLHGIRADPKMLERAAAALKPKDPPPP